MSIILDDLRGMAQSGVPLCDLAADEIESLEQAYELLFKENAKLRAQADQQAQPPSYENIADMLPSILSTGTEQCPLCGKTGMHQHSPEEIIIYRNGCKYGRSLTSPPAQPQVREETVTGKMIDAALCAYDSVATNQCDPYAIADALRAGIAAAPAIRQPQAEGKKL